MFTICVSISITVFITIRCNCFVYQWCKPVKTLWTITWVRYVITHSVFHSTKSSLIVKYCEIRENPHTPVNSWQALVFLQIFNQICTRIHSIQTHWTNLWFQYTHQYEFCLLKRDVFLVFLSIFLGRYQIENAGNTPRASSNNFLNAMTISEGAQHPAVKSSISRICSTSDCIKTRRQTQ